MSKASLQPAKLPSGLAPLLSPPPTLSALLCPPTALASLLLNMPGTFPPQSLCSNRSFCLEHSSPGGPLTSPPGLCYNIPSSTRFFLGLNLQLPIWDSLSLPQPYFPLQCLFILVTHWLWFSLLSLAPPWLASECLAGREFFLVIGFSTPSTALGIQQMANEHLENS